MGGFVINQTGTDQEPQYVWFLDIGGPEDAVATSFLPSASEEEVVAAIRRLQEADLAALPIRVREGSRDRLVE